MPTRTQAEFERSLVEALRSNNVANAISEAILSTITKKLAEKFDRNDIASNGSPENNQRCCLCIQGWSKVGESSILYNNKKLLKGTGYIMKEDLTAMRLRIVKEASDKYGFKNVWTLNNIIMD
nr:unnamed protein product [Callosobruchus chinensis]